MKIIFTGDFPDLMFVEVEDDNGKSINAGEWTKEDEFWVLNIKSVEV